MLGTPEYLQTSLGMKNCFSLRATVLCVSFFICTVECKWRVGVGLRGEDVLWVICYINISYYRFMDTCTHILNVGYLHG